MKNAMNDHQAVLAVDIGASSGRHILGWLEDGKIRTKEVYRFENSYTEKDGHFCWDIEGLYRHVLAGMRVCGEAGQAPVSVGVDTWGVDYVLLDRDGKRVGDAIAYRDSRTADMDKRLETIFSFGRLYGISGIAKQPFNTLYQLMADKAEGRLDKADLLLFMPCYLSYLLSGNPVNEYTIASTGALLDAKKRAWAPEILAAAGVPESLMRAPLVMPGTDTGRLTEGVRRKVGYDCRVILPCTHDTGSAYLAVPGAGENSVILSSGTWSLLGVENPEPVTDETALRSGFTNEGGWQGGIRFLKNIMGLWMIQSVRRENPVDGQKVSWAELAGMAEREKDFPGVVDVTDNRFLAPASMTEEIRKALAEQGAPVFKNLAQLSACIVNSLALCYRDAIRGLSEVTGQTYTDIHIVGGGCLNEALNRRTAEMTGLPVIAGPDEGTALGNILAQLIACGQIPDLPTAREILLNSVETKRF